MILYSTKCLWDGVVSATVINTKIGR
jgi:hypothetical protein